MLWGGRGWTCLRLAQDHGVRARPVRTYIVLVCFVTVRMHRHPCLTPGMTAKPVSRAPILVCRRLTGTFDIDWRDRHDLGSDIIRLPSECTTRKWRHLLDHFFPMFNIHYYSFFKTNNYRQWKIFTLNLSARVWQILKRKSLKQMVNGKALTICWCLLGKKTELWMNILRLREMPKNINKKITKKESFDPNTFTLIQANFRSITTPDIL
jgi:hypothetical protein